MRAPARGLAGGRRDRRAAAARRSSAPTRSRPRRTSSRASRGWCAAGELAPCEFVNVESEFAAMSVAIGACADGRARLHRDGQPGPAVHDRGAVQRRRARPADRDDASPTARSARRSTSGTTTATRCRMRDCGWIQLYAATTRRPLDLHVQAFRLAEELSLPVMVCMDGFVLTHAVRAAGGARAGAGRRASCRRSRRARCSTRTSRSRSARWSGPRPSRRSATWPMPSRCEALDADPRDRRGVRARLRPRLGRPAPPLPLRGRRDGRGRARLGARHDRTTSSTSCASRACAIGAVALKSFRPVPAGRAVARRSAARSGWSCSSARSPSASAASSRADVRTALAGLAVEMHTVIAGLGGRRDHAGARCATLFGDAVAGRLEALRFLDLGPTSSSASSARARGARPARSARREHPARPRPRRRGAGMSETRFYQTGSFAVGNRLLDADAALGAGRPRARRTRSPTATAPARAAARRSGRATRSTPRCAPPADG